MVPSAAAWTAGTQACSLAGSALGGVWLTLTGSDQVSPPSEDMEKAIWSTPANRVSCQVTYRLPLLGSTAASGVNPSARIGSPVSGSKAPMNRILWITCGADRVAPLSVERIMARLAPGALLPDPWNNVNRSISSPLGRTTIWWPMVACSLLGAKMARAGSQVAPPSVVREKMASPRKEKACWALKLARSLGNL